MFRSPPLCGSQGLQPQKSGDFPDEEAGPGAFGLGDKTPNRRRFKSVAGEAQLEVCRRKIDQQMAGMIFFEKVSRFLKMEFLEIKSEADHVF